jgi:hypothetical protein
MSPDCGLSYGQRGSLVIQPEFDASAVGQTRLLVRAAFLWLARQANHAAFTKQLDGRAITVERGEWFGSYAGLAAVLGVDKKTLARILRTLTSLGAVTVEAVERPQRYRKGTVNGGKEGPLNGGGIPPQRSGNRTDVRCLGTLIKVHGWKELRPVLGNGGKIPPQASTSDAAPDVRRVPRLSAAQQATNAAASAALRRGAL